MGTLTCKTNFLMTENNKNMAYARKISSLRKLQAKESINGKTTHQGRKHIAIVITTEKLVLIDYALFFTTLGASECTTN